MLCIWLVAAFAGNPVDQGPWHNYGEFEIGAVNVPFSDYTELVFVDGYRANLHFSLLNSGSFGVTVTDIGVFPARANREDWTGPLIQESVTYRVGPDLQGPMLSLSGAPIVLAPKVDAAIAVTTLMGNCDRQAPGVSTGHSEVLVTYSYLGLTRSHLIPFPPVYTTIPDPCTANSLQIVQTNTYEGPDRYHSSLVDMAAAAELVAVGSVSEVKSLRYEGEPSTGDERREVVAITIQVEQLVKGNWSGQTISLPWDAFRVDEDGTRTATYVVEGIGVPEVGQRLFLFVDPINADEYAFWGEGNVTHQLTTYEGIFRVVDGVVSSDLDDANRLPHTYNGAYLEDMIDEIDFDN